MGQKSGNTAVLGVWLVIWLSASATANAAIELISRIDSTPPIRSELNRGAYNPSINDDGRFSAFGSTSSNLGTGGTNGRFNDIFVFDRESNTTEILTNGANEASFNPEISGNGRYVAFISRATNLADGVSDADLFDIFAHDRDTDTTSIVSAGSNGNSFHPSIDTTGRFIAFESSASNLVATDSNGDVSDIFVYDQQTGSTELLTAGANGASVRPAISADGRYVAFHSQANNLVGGDFNGAADVFVYDRETNSVELITAGPAYSSSSPTLSANGRFVAFNGNSFARRDVFLHDRETSTTQNLSANGNANSYDPSISNDGEWVTFLSAASNLGVGDTNGVTTDAILYRRTTGAVELITAGSNNITPVSRLSGDGQFMIIDSLGSTLVPVDTNNSRDVFLYNRNERTFELLPPGDFPFEIAGGNANSAAPATSTNGRFIAFESLATNLAGPDTNNSVDIFVFDRETGNNQSLTSGANGNNTHPAVSGDGRFVTFESSASNLVPGDSNGHADIFVFDRDTANTSGLTLGGNGDSRLPSISEDGRFIAFESDASNLVSTDANGNTPDVFLYDTSTTTTTLLTPAGNSDSRTPAVSADGRFVAFASQASNLATGDTTTNVFDIFVYDRITSTTELLTPGGNSSSLAPSISSDGQFVAFESHASNLVNGDTNGSIRDIFVHDRNSGLTEHVTPNATVNVFGNTSISSDGRLVVFTSDDTGLVAGDINGVDDVFLYNRDTSTISRLTPSADGSSSAAAISGDGRAIAFVSLALNLANDGTRDLTDVFVSVSNDPPSADPLSISTSEDTPLTLTLTGSDPELEALVFAIVTQPVNGTLTGSAPNLVYTPNANYFGADNFDFSVSDGTGNSSPATVAITVDPVNDAPQANAITGLTISEDTPFTITLLGNDIDGDSLSFAITSQPLNGAFFGTAPELIYAPNDNFNGTDSFSYTTSDGALTSPPVTVGLTITPINDVPLAVSQSLLTTTNTPISITLAGTDVDNEMLDFSIASFPANGALSGDLPNLLYTPLNSFSGTDSFTFTVSDGASTSNTGTLTVVVAPADQPTPVNRSPVANAGSLSTPRETPVSILLTGSDADGDALTFNLLSAPANGSLAGNAPDLTYTPDINFVGTDSLTFTVSDDQDSSESATVLINVVDGTISLLAAVLPASRSVEIGTTATAFATLINAGTIGARGCRIELPDTISGELFYQTSDVTTNAVTGVQNQPVDIPAGASQAFVFGITPSEELAATHVALRFVCQNAIEATSIVGLNTLLLSASLTPVPDLIALAATTSNNGVMEFANNNGFFSSATINVGSASTITVSADTGSVTLPLTLRLCQTDPATSVCINPAQASTEPVVVEILSNGSPTFAVFATASEPIALDPANSRVFLRFSDESGVVRGATSVAVQN